MQVYLITIETLIDGIFIFKKRTIYCTRVHSVDSLLALYDIVSNLPSNVTCYLN